MNPQGKIKCDRDTDSRKIVQGKDVAVKSGTHCTKTGENLLTGAFSSKTVKNIPVGTPGTKTVGDLQEDGAFSSKTQNMVPVGTSSTKTDGGLRVGSSSSKIQNVVPAGTSGTKTDGNFGDGASSSKTEKTVPGGTPSTKTDGHIRGGAFSTNTDKMVPAGTSSTKTDGNIQNGASSSSAKKIVPGGTSSTKTDGKIRGGAFSSNTGKTVPSGTSSTKTDGNIRDGASSSKIEKIVSVGTSGTKTDGRIPDGTSSLETQKNISAGTFSTKTDGRIPDGTSSLETQKNIPAGTFSTKTDGRIKSGTYTLKSQMNIPAGTCGTKTEDGLQQGANGSTTEKNFQPGTCSTRRQGKFPDGAYSSKTVRNFHKGDSSVGVEGEQQHICKKESSFQDGTSSPKERKQENGFVGAKEKKNSQDGTFSTNAEGKQKTAESQKISVHQVRAGSSFVQVSIGSMKINARIDSGAEITILSSKIYDSLKKAPAKVKAVDLKMADNDTVMKGFVIQPLKMRLGNQCFSERLYVASIGDDMLLGHDLLHHLGVCLDWQTETMMLNGERIPLTTTFKDSRVTVARVSISKRTVVPPNSVVRLTCKLNTKMKEDYVIEPVDELKLLMPRTVCTADSEPVVCLVNPSDSWKTLKKGTVIGSATKDVTFPEEDIGSDVSSSNTRPNVSQVSQQANEEKDESSKSFEPEREIPEHLKKLYDASIGNLDAEQQQKLKQLLCDYPDVFARHDFDLGTVTAIQHNVDTGTAKPIKQRMRRTPVCFANEEEELLKKMLDAGVIQEPVSDWASSPVLIRKRDGSVRWCIDYRALNDVTIKDTFPLPIIEDCLDTLSGNIWFSKLDANSAYWQVLVNPEDRKKTAFLTKYGLFEHVRMGFGMTNSPATFSRVISLILRGLTWKTVLAFLDDILILGMSFEDHLKNLAEAFERFRQYGLKLKARKCILFQSEVEFLGRIVSSNQLKMSTKDITTVTDWPVPKTSKEVERFLGLANYHRSFIKDFAVMAQPLYGLTGKNKFKWDDEEQMAFDELKEALTNPPVLTLPNSYDSFILDTDASDFCIGAELIQVQDGQERVIAYSSFTLTPEQKNYCTTRKELLSIVRFTRQFRHYLLGRIFTVRTDHSSLTWLLKFKDPQGQLARWMEELSQYNMVVKHRSGSKHGNADALSRIPDRLTPCASYVAGIKPADLPCGGCHYCLRADQQWSDFTRDVDEAVSLTNPTSTIVARNTAEGPGSEYVQRINNMSVTAVKPTSAGTKVSGCQNQNTSGSALPLDPERSCNNTNAARKDNVGICEDFGEFDSIGLSDIHFDVVRNGTGMIDICANSVTVAENTSEQLTCWGFSTDELKEEQEKDKDLKTVIHWLKTQQEPDQGILFLSSPESKYYWVNKDMFKLVDDVLFRQKTDSKDVELVVPDSLKDQALFLHHDIPSAAHQGIARTKAKLREKFFWVRLPRDVESYVLSCSECNKNKKNKRYGKVPLTEYQAGAPMERVHIDFLGPLPKTERGNEHCLMLVDQFTKWVECIPLPTQKAEITARAAVDQFFSRFGFPLHLFSDQGRNFESKLFEALCKALEIHKARTTPYRPSANGQVERFNRTLMDAVRCFLGKSQNKWDQPMALDGLLALYCPTVCSSNQQRQE